MAKAKLGNSPARPASAPALKKSPKNRPLPKAVEALADSRNGMNQLAERVRLAMLTLQTCAEVNPNKRGGVPVLRGTRFTVAQLFAEIADGRAIKEIAEDFDLDLETIKTLLQGFSIQLDRPMVQ